MCLWKNENDQLIVSSPLKYTLFVFSVIYWLFGLGLVLVGIYACVEKDVVMADFGNLITDPAIIILIFGCGLFCLTFFAWVGAIRENICMLKFFSITLSISLFLQFITGFVIIVLSDQVENVVENYFHLTIEKYRENLDLQNIIDWGQEEFYCCGAQSYRDWDNNRYFNCSETNPSYEKCSVPWSCCIVTDPNAVKNTLCGIGVLSKPKRYAGILVYTTGCIPTIIEWFHEHIFLLACLAVGLAIPQIVGVCLSRILLIQIKDQKRYSDERWFLKGTLVESEDQPAGG